MDDLSNRIVKCYELKECVGTGGFGQVYRAFQPSVAREVAVKVILPQHANQPDFIRRFEVEAQLIAHLEHPHIVPLYDYWRDPEGAFLVMRWLKGSLRASILGGPWSVEAASRLLDEIAAALTVAHREGIIHRDIKPDNILLDEDDNAYLADFGIAKDLNVAGNTQEGAVVGSLAYITPEQINGEAVTARSDIYSLGLVLYEILVSEKPFPTATTPYEWINVHLNMPLPHLNLQRPTLPVALNEVLQTATAKDPALRYPNVLRLAAAFRAALPTPHRGPTQPLAEPLTERELDILRLMIEGLSNQEMARKLFLTVGTVKWYVNQIYTKLDVHSRHQAVQRALHLDLMAGTGQASPPLSASVSAPPKPERQALSLSIPRTEFINPYKGLRAFQEGDAHDFFGRAALTEQLLTRLVEKDSSSQFLVVVGPSGSGKSSVVKAGLIPALRRGALPNSARWFITEMLPGTQPVEELEAALLRVAVTSLPGLLDQLAEDRRGLVRAAKRLLPPDQDVELVVVIDQFEELFTLLPDETIRVHFIDNILSAVTDPRSRVRVILTIRADFYDKPLLYPRLAELVGGHTEVVVPLTSPELERAIAGPAERIGLQFEPGLVNTIINDIGEQPGTLPLLQYALTELFERREGVMLTLDAYKASDRISGSLARRADELYGELEADGQAAARQLFLRLITLGEGTEDTRRRTLQSELERLGNEWMLDEVINAFVQYRLLTLDRDPVTRSPTVEIAHEALIREWGRLRAWLTESREDLRVQRRLMTAAADWENSKYEQSFLASGARLAQFETLASDSDLALNTNEHAYLNASVTERERQTDAEQKRQKRERALERRSVRFLRILAVVLLVAAIGALGLTGVAQNNAVRAERNAAEARSLALASAAQLALNEGSIDRAIALAKEAQQLTDSPPPLAQLVLGQAAYMPATRQIFLGNGNVGNSVLATAKNPLKFVMVAHIGPQFPFAKAMIKGMQDACGFLNASCQWLSDPVAGIDNMAAYWDQALAMNPDGIGTTIIDPQIIRGPVQQAAKRGIPVVVFNIAVAQDSDPSLATLLYIGSDEFVSGANNARRVFAEARADGVIIRRGVCPKQMARHSGLDARCAGVKSVFDEAGVPLDQIPIDSDSIALEARQIGDYFREHRETTAIFLLGPDPASALKLYIQQAGLKPRQLYATTHDTSPEIFQMIRDGYLLQTIDQQPYMQGFQTIISLYLYRQYQLRPSGFINTSSVVDQSNVDLVMQLMEAGYR